MESIVILGAVTGCIYGLFAVGLVAPYRATKVINLAHGEIGMVGTFAYLALRNSNVPEIVCVIVGVAVGAALAALVQVLVIKPVLAIPIRGMVATLGVATLIITWASRRYGSGLITINPLISGRAVAFLSVRLSPSELLILGAVVCVLIFYGVYVRSRFGTRDRAVAEDWVAAAQLGINVNIVMVRAWAIGGAIAAIAGILIAPTVGYTVQFMTSLDVLGLVAALVTGLTRPIAAFVAGVLIGVLNAVIGDLTPAIGATYAVLGVGTIALLLIRPPWMRSATL
jgi:branched-subunit amino acid ABC-type transport system permease component